MITEHIMSPAVERWKARERTLTAWMIAVVAIAYACFLVALRRSCKRLDVELAREREEAAALEAAAELEDFVATIVEQRGRCTCGSPVRCDRPRCILCHACSKVFAAPPPIRAVFDPTKPTYREAQRAAFKDAIASNRPYDAPPAPIGDLPPGSGA